MVRMQGLGAQRGHVRTGPSMLELTSDAGNQMVRSGGAWQAVSAHCITSTPQPGASLALLWVKSGIVVQREQQVNKAKQAEMLITKKEIWPAFQALFP